MARATDASLRRALEAEAAVGEQSRALQDAKQRLSIAARQVETERIGAERLRTMICAHEVTIAAHEKAISKHEAALSASVGAANTEAGLAKETLLAEHNLQKAAFAEAERRVVALQQSYDVACDATVVADKAATKAMAERDVALNSARSMEAEVSALRAAEDCQVCTGNEIRRRDGAGRGGAVGLGLHGGLDAGRALVVSDAAATTGHCIAVGIGVEAGVVDVCGEWGEWYGACDLSQTCTQFYDAVGEAAQRRNSSNSSDGDDIAHVGAANPEPVDSLVDAIIADLKERMEVNIKARVSIPAAA